MDLHVRVTIESRCVLTEGTVSGKGYLRMFIFEADPIKRVGVGVINLVQMVMEVKLFEIFSGKEVLSFRSLQ